MSWSNIIPGAQVVSRRHVCEVSEGALVCDVLVVIVGVEVHHCREDAQGCTSTEHLTLSYACQIRIKMLLL